jgi:hypothetical protein
MYVKCIYLAHLSCKHATNDADKIASVVRHLCRQFVKDVDNHLKIALSYDTPNGKAYGTPFQVGSDPVGSDADERPSPRSLSIGSCTNPQCAQTLVHKSSSLPNIHTGDLLSVERTVPDFKTRLQFTSVSPEGFRLRVMRLVELRQKGIPVKGWYR